MFAILSVYQSDKSSVLNQVNHERILARSAGFTEVKGKYKGIPERSILIPCIGSKGSTINDWISRLLRVGKEFNQESILLVDSDSRASLLYCADSRIEYLGQWSEIKEDIEKLDAYSIINSRIFTVN